MLKLMVFGDLLLTVPGLRVACGLWVGHLWFRWHFPLVTGAMMMIGRLNDDCVILI